MKNHGDFWLGRIDGISSEHLRWHQAIDFQWNEVKNLNQNFVIAGFECDEGVRRNKGRIGAKQSPNILRTVCSNFPIHTENFTLFDAGNITCNDQNLEKSQEKLAELVQEIHQKNGKTLLLGGGHEITFAHFSGLRKYYKTEKIGIINFDAHFDNRKIEPEIGATSGTGFYQIATQEKIHSLTIGIQKNSNTKALFNYAENQNMQYILADELHILNLEMLQKTVSEFLQSIDILYVTICLDVFACAVAPGVSATAYNGIFPDFVFQQIFNTIIQSEKLKAFDIAELNPNSDIDYRTAKLAASFIFKVVNEKI